MALSLPSSCHESRRWGAGGRGPASPCSNGARSFPDNAIRAQGLMDMALAFKSHPLTDRLIPPTVPEPFRKNTGGLLILVWGCRGNCIPCEMHCHNISVLFGTLKDTASSSSGPQSMGHCQMAEEGWEGTVWWGAKNRENHWLWKCWLSSFVPARDEEP